MWQDEAACLNTEFVWIDRGNTSAKKAVCHQCRVVNQCLKFAIDNNDFEATVYGGFTGEERHRLVENGIVV